MVTQESDVSGFEHNLARMYEKIINYNKEDPLSIKHRNKLKLDLKHLGTNIGDVLGKIEHYIRWHGKYPSPKILGKKEKEFLIKLKGKPDNNNMIEYEGPAFPYHAYQIVLKWIKASYFGGNNVFWFDEWPF